MASLEGRRKCDEPNSVRRRDCRPEEPVPALHACGSSSSSARVPAHAARRGAAEAEACAGRAQPRLRRPDWTSERETLLAHVYIIFAWAALMMKFWKNLTGPCGAPTYLPTYLPYLWETKKEITRRVKVGYYTN